MSLITLFVIVPLGSAFLLPILNKIWKGFPDWVGNLASVFLMGLSIWMIQFAQETIVYFVGHWEPVQGIPIGIALVVDGLSVLMLLIINVVAFLVMLYSISYMSHYTDKGKYYTLFLLMLAGLNGVVISGDLFNLFVFLEITAISSYALVAYGVEAEELEASFKYQVLGGTASMLILFGIAIFYHLTGTLNLADASRVLSEKTATLPLYLVSALFIAGFGLKAALMPFHAWLPDAHPSAPAPISAMLSGVVIKVLGIYALIRIFFNVLGLGTVPFFLNVLLVLGTLSMTAGSFLALGQKDFKRLLAYSSISQIGFVAFGLGLGTTLGIVGALFHLVNHAVSKSLLFLNSGAVDYETNNRNLLKMGGLSQKMPVTATTSLVGSLSISGLPPVSGFWSKLVIVVAAVQCEQYVLAGVAVLVSIVTLAYYMKLQQFAFYGHLNDIYQKIKEVPIAMCVAMIVLAVFSFGLGVLLIPSLREIFLDPAVKVITDGIQYSKMVLGG